MAQQHGSVGGRVAGDGNTSAIEQAGRVTFGDPATDPIGTWRIEPTPDLGDPEANDEAHYHRTFDIAVPRVVRIAGPLSSFPWVRVVPDQLGHRDDAPVQYADRFVASWPYTTATMVAAAEGVARTTAARQRGEQEAVPSPVPLVTGEECENLFR